MTQSDFIFYITCHIIVGLLFVATIELLTTDDKSVKNKLLANVFYWPWFLLGRTIVGILKLFTK